MTELRDAALRYAEYGWLILPLRERGKEPLLPNGVLGASNDTTQVAAWWDRWPNANIGMATGAGSGIVAIDVDSMPALEGLGDRPGLDTARVSTSKGVHLLYRADATRTFPNTVGRLASGIDTRGDNGYIVLPPSVHPDGSDYQWVSKQEPEPLPDWVWSAIERKAEPSADEGPAERATPYGLAVRNSEVARLVQAKEGVRNATLFSVAVRLFELVKADQLGRKETTGVLFKAARASGLEIEEVDRTIRSAWDRATPKPPSTLDGPSHEQAPVSRPVVLSLTDLRSIAPPRWLVPNILPEGFTVLYGQRGGGKTFQAIDLSLTLASHGKTVLYCSGEGVSGLASRVDAWIQAHPGLNPGDAFLTMAYDAFPRLVREPSVGRLYRAFEDLEEQGKTPALIVIDTWRRALAGTSTSSDEAVTQAIDVLDTLRSKWGTSSLVIHHPRRPSRDEPNPPEAGSGALLDNADCAWKLVTGDVERVMYCEKVKEWDELPPVRFQLRSQGNSLVVKPSAADSMG